MTKYGNQAVHLAFDSPDSPPFIPIHAEGALIDMMNVCSEHAPNCIHYVHIERTSSMCTKSVRHVHNTTV